MEKLERKYFVRSAVIVHYFFFFGAERDTLREVPLTAEIPEERFSE